MPKNAVNGSNYICDKMSYVAHEVYKKMRTNTLLALPQDEKCKIVGITSAQPGEGKSTTAINLAYSFAELGHKVLLVDADLRRPSIADKLNLSLGTGLGELLTDSNDISAAIQHYQNDSGTFGFDTIGGSGFFENASELLSSRRFTSFIETLRENYEYVFFDLPPIDAVIDAVIVGKHTDGMILVVRENKIPKKQFGKCISQLEFASVKILGVVVNGSAEGTGGKYRNNSYSYY